MYRLPSVFTSSLRLIPASALSIPVFRVLDMRGQVISGAEHYVRDLDRAVLKKMLHTMLQVEQMDLLYLKLQRLNYITFYMTAQGEEGVQAGCAAGLKDEDWLCLQYREMGLCLYRGISLQEVAHQIHATRLDPNKGHQTPLLFASQTARIQTTSPPLGTQLPHAAGIGYALRMQGKQSVCLGLFGDGAASEGDAHAGMNFASTRQSQTLFFCRNNGFAISTPSTEQYAGQGIAERGVGYGMPAVRVDGNDPIAVLQATKTARAEVLNRSGPVLVEALTYRRGHHSTSDDSTRYRSQDATHHYETVDNSILRFSKFLQLHGLLDTELEQMRKSAAEEVKVAWEEAKDTQQPSWEAMFEDVYDHPTPELLQQKAEFGVHYHKYKQYYDNKILH